MYFTSYVKRNYPPSSAFISNFPHTAAPLPNMIVTGTRKLYTKELIQGKFTAKGNNSRYLPVSQVKLITLTLIITTDTEYSCEPTWPPRGTCSGIVTAGPMQNWEVRGATQWEVTLHPSYRDQDKILSPEWCLYKLKENKSSTKVPRSLDTAGKESAQPSCIGSINSSRFFFHITGKNLIQKYPVWLRNLCFNTFNRSWKIPFLEIRLSSA